MNNIMTPEHELWHEFVDRLSGPEGCNIEKRKKDDPVWLCNETTVFAESILKTMPGLDVKKSLLYFEEHGGYCDCEILMNVDNTTDFAKMILGEWK